MPITDICIENIRCIERVELKPHKKFNFLSGPNGSGKSSFLEAVYLLGMARSFRTKNIKKIISNNEEECRVLAQYVDHAGAENRAGISKSRDSSTIIRLNQQTLKTASLLARILPVRILSQESFSLIDGPSKERRQFIDWLGFHVEHRFNETWTSVQRLIKQRNSLLRQGSGLNRAELAIWDAELSLHGKMLTEFRSQVFLSYMENFTPLRERLLPDIKIQLNFYQGWPESIELAQSLRDNIERDVNLGYTHSSPNRADFHIRVDGKLASDCLSRGQKKLLVYALTLAQITTFSELKDDDKAPSIILIDDIGAELDEHNRHLLIDTLDVSRSQVFITGTELVVPETSLEKSSYKMFHVEQGSVTPA